MRPLHRIVIATAVLFSYAANVFSYSNTIFFGDSLTDSGTYKSETLVQLFPVSGKFTTNPGPVWSEVLADKLGTQATPANAGGTNYAAGGARVTSLPGYPSSPLAPFVAAASPIEHQISAYLSSRGGRADAQALYTVWAGANDIFAIQANDDATYNPAPISQTADELADQIGRLKTAGARHIVAFNLPDIGSTPGSIADGAAASAQATQLVQSYNHELYTQLATQGVRVIPIDTFDLLRTVMSYPAPFGFTNTTTPACAGVLSSLICTSENYAAGDELTHVFADGVHPSTAAHKIIADYVLSILSAPQQVAALPVSAVAERAALHDLLRTQLVAGSLQREQSGRHFWLSAQGVAINRENSTLNPGTNQDDAQLAMGLDFAASEQLVLGGAISAGHGSADFADQRGDFSQNSTTLSAYGSWHPQAWYVNGALSYGNLDYALHRRVPLGLSALTAHGDTQGRDLSVQLEGGYEFSVGMLAHGPFLGLVAQDVRVDGFDETDGGFINLGYDTQNRHSRVGSAGWQLSYRADSWLPYARIGVTHEFEDNDHTVTQSQLSIPEALSYDMPVTDFKRTRYPLQLGVTGALPGNVEFNLGAGHDFGPDDVRTTRVYAGFSTRF